MTRGRFVVVEGGDGSGKSTQASRLAAELRGRGLEVCETFEPGATAAGAVMRELLLHGSHPVTPVAEALLMAADRAQHVAEVVRPALERGAWVVTDRFLPSSLVYQGVVRGLGVDMVRSVNASATGGVEPDAVVVLDVDEAGARARRGWLPGSHGVGGHRLPRRGRGGVSHARGVGGLDAGRRRRRGRRGRGPGPSRGLAPVAVITRLP